MKFPAELKYTPTHEWAREEESRTVVGITEHAQKELSDVVFIELPPVGKVVKQGEPICVIESVKAAFDIYAPLSGTVQETNQALTAEPGLMNRDPYGEGWLFALVPQDASEWDQLLPASKYEQSLATERAH